MPEDTSRGSRAPVALVTGASRGIGRELVLGLARAGWAVGALARDAVALDEVVEEVTVAGGRAVATPVDVTDDHAVAAAVHALEAELGGAALLVNCAGRIEADEAVPWEADPDEVRRVLEANVLGPLHLVRAVVPGMVARGGGRVVDLSSGAAHKDSALHAGYAASKAALFRLGGAVTAAGREHGVLAFELSPGVVRTDMSTSMAQHADRTEWTAPADVVALVLAIGRGELDAWAGRLVRAGADTPASLVAAARAGLPERARCLDLLPYGPGDPLT
ncbi:SDR family oxidoreductase [Paenibacillus sp. TRM 82003]|uniref:SDR family NAD(P)-dependent oxidoreductase n=1 Tax=Kineococcus sp. TRM81007 TaxID=2925831 RepID=UPI001F5A4174|nr:SDR family oxidoreductase [Kineococcus sp. TRM81007]MCI2239752.1 SDR family oxidoreductase [Kineococcus sp. TRM81007]MCI3926686.1 SDR family oxidoreductase [Paenibacillus sp. TRM 82003]